MTFYFFFSMAENIVFDWKLLNFLIQNILFSPLENGDFSNGKFYAVKYFL